MQSKNGTRQLDWLIKHSLCESMKNQNQSSWLEFRKFSSVRYGESRKEIRLQAHHSAPGLSEPSSSLCCVREVSDADITAYVTIHMSVSNVLLLPGYHC